MSNRFKTACAVALILEHDNKILFIHRGKVKINPDCWSIVAGHIDEGESAIQAMVREAYEEIGITIDPANLTLVHTSYAYQPAYGEIMSLYFTCNRWDGEIINKEPHKHVELSWFPKSTLPQPMIEHVAYSLTKLFEGHSFSEWGWEK
jgi:8-oxo-dGTP diphosphatase